MNILNKYHAAVLALLLFTASIFVVLLAGCTRSNPKSPDMFGSISIEFKPSTDLLRKTIEPDIEMVISEYQVSGIGPDGASFTKHNITEET